ncbi:hypothetical protein HRED_06712 [Candidatus Haloredivivus sp. G17]|nr:hypothetical protein HRED_06712 [Candidatus Haloredivivus sp. G17]
MHSDDDSTAGMVTTSSEPTAISVPLTILYSPVELLISTSSISASSCALLDVLNLDMIPYHSSNIHSIDKEAGVEEYLTGYRELIEKIINLHDRTFIVITGEDTYDFLFPNDKPELKEMNPSRRKKVNYGKTELFGEDAVIVKQHLPRGLKEPAKYLLGQTLRHMD